MLSANAIYKKNEGKNAALEILEGIGRIAGAINRKPEPVVVVERPVYQQPAVEIMLPSQAFGWDDQVMVNVHNIREIRTESDFDYYLILNMYDGREIRVKYSFKSRMQTDLNKILKLRGMGAPRYSAFREVRIIL